MSTSEVVLTVESTGTTPIEIDEELTNQVHISSGSSTITVELGVLGPKGDPGEPGPPGSSTPVSGTGDLHYTHSQMSASTAWVVIHNLGKFPNVSVVDSAGTGCEGLVVYDSMNQVTLSFSAAFAGTAYFN